MPLGLFQVQWELLPGSWQCNCELWHNTLFVDRGALIVDFMLDQLDVKRKLEKKLDPEFTLRLKFSKEPPAEGEVTPSKESKTGASVKEYEMVSTHEEVEIQEQEVTSMDEDNQA